MRSWPIIVAARSTVVAGGGTFAHAGVALAVRPRPKSRAGARQRVGRQAIGQRDEGGVARLREVAGEGHRRRPPRPRSCLNALPSTVMVFGQSTVSVDLQAGAQQRGGRDDLERRAGGVAARRSRGRTRLGRAGWPRRGRRPSRAAPRRARTSARWRRAPPPPPPARAVERRAQLAPLAAGAAAAACDGRAGARADDDAARGRAGQLVLVARLRPNWPTSSPTPTLPFERWICSAVAGPTVPSSARANVLLGASCCVLGTACAPWIASTCWASVDG